jgi:uncharacterized repeat protein (TIGR04076 family)
MAEVNQQLLEERRKSLPNHWESCNKVKVTVESIRGICTAGFQVGDYWILQKYTPPMEFCGMAFLTLYPSIRSLVFDGKIPFAKNNVLRVACPDAKNCTVFSVSVLVDEE